ncbi:uncharacterized protein LOC125084396 [Lutra lutra]|uniref:uncharacterized protein LOC125084396 n=1 Tax=Lutra lutra TaxID=9657 RepID=UPI001FD31F37|nr:uncharacterized protein LOC125084396 [Lutra lutra]
MSAWASPLTDAFIRTLLCCSCMLVVFSMLCTAYCLHGGPEALKSRVSVDERLQRVKLQSSASGSGKGLLTTLYSHFQGHPGLFTRVPYPPIHPRAISPPPPGSLMPPVQTLRGAWGRKELAHRSSAAPGQWSFKREWRISWVQVTETHLKLTETQKMTSFGFCYLDLLIISWKRGSERRDRRGHKVTRGLGGRESQAGGPSEITPCRLIPQGRREQRRRRRCGRPLPSPEGRGGTGRCWVERRPPPAAARGPAELSPPSSTCPASAGSSSPRQPRSAGAVPRPLPSGSCRFLPATVGQRFRLWL